MRILAGEFTIAKWEEQSFMDTPLPAKANEANISYKVSGDLEGELRGKYIMIYNDDAQASYNGALQFAGTIGEQSGSFFIQETGKFADNVATTSWVIIKGSGTRDFKTISGTGRYSAKDRSVNFELEVEGV